MSTPRPQSRLAESSVFRWIVCPALLLVSLVWYLAAFRLLSLPLLLLSLVAWLTLSRHGQVRRVALAWGAFLASTLLPFDISLRPNPHPFRFVRYVMGLPSEAGIEAIRRGDVAPGGCVTDGLEPRWVFVWLRDTRPIPWDDISDRHLRALGLA